MSILVKGMKMPTRCEDCPVCHYMERGTITVCGCKATMMIRPIDCNSKPHWCPLVEVPTPHGDLIEKDALEQDAQGRLLECDKYDNQFNKPFEIMRAIRLAPVIIAADMEWKMKNCCCCDDKTVIQAKEETCTKH